MKKHAYMGGISFKLAQGKKLFGFVRLVSLFKYKILLCTFVITFVKRLYYYIGLNLYMAFKMAYTSYTPIYTTSIIILTYIYIM